MKSLRMIAMAAVLSIGALSLVGCGGVSAEELAALEALKKETSKLETDNSGLLKQKQALENEIKEKNKKLEECNKQKQETQANLKKMNK
ncbi:MAG: hypothetical protein HUU43_04740 [Ignavibacteriaceae bacterium]|nr:hypothetical protein [Ignavibacteriaceae bacterium]NUM70130.1 hypothetical protein [Ignavibacteriaceae bacterium]